MVKKKKKRTRSTGQAVRRPIATGFRERTVGPFPATQATHDRPTITIINIATGETSPAITPFHFFGNFNFFNFHHSKTFITRQLSTGIITHQGHISPVSANADSLSK